MPAIVCFGGGRQYEIDIEVLLSETLTRGEQMAHPMLIDIEFQHPIPAVVHHLQQQFPLPNGAIDQQLFDLKGCDDPCDRRFDFEIGINAATTPETNAAARIVLRSLRP